MELTQVECDSFTTMEAALVWAGFPSKPESTPLFSQRNTVPRAGCHEHTIHPRIVGNVGATTLNAIAILASVSAAENMVSKAAGIMTGLPERLDDTPKRKHPVSGPLLVVVTEHVKMSTTRVDAFTVPKLVQTLRTCQG